MQEQMPFLALVFTCWGKLFSPRYLILGLTENVRPRAGLFLNDSSCGWGFLVVSVVTNFTGTKMTPSGF